MLPSTGVPVCLACSTTTPETSGRFCPECGAVIVAAAKAAADKASVASTQSLSAPTDKDRGSLVGTKIDGFAIEGVIGGGAFGTVYRGRQLGLDRVVALKVPTYEIAADPVMAKRFAREAKAAGRIDHPGVVSIYQVGELPDGRPYLAMQFVEGEPLDRILKDGPLPVVRALGIARQIASALSDTHVADVVHRDLKPSNIMWRRDRHGDDRITLVDFGIAVCKFGTAEASRLTENGLIGTPHYMSPEQAHGDAVDARADLYALGCLLFELVTGETPYAGSGFEVLLAHLGRPAPRPSDRIAEIPEAIDRLVLALMAKKPAERIATADAVVELIDDALETLEEQAPSVPVKSPRAKRKTASTRRDKYPLPIPRSATEGIDAELSHAAPEAPGHRARWMALGALLAFCVSVGAVLGARLITDSSATASVDDRDPTTVTRREILRDDGETRLRVWVPDPFVVGKSRLRIELRNKLGAVIKAETLLVTVEDPQGAATAIKARPRQEDESQFGFLFDYARPGTYQLRVFPPEDATRSPSTFSVPLDVVAKPTN